MSKSGPVFEDFTSSKKRQQRITLTAACVGLIFAALLTINFIRIEKPYDAQPGAIAKILKLEGKVMIKRGAKTVAYQPEMFVLAGDSLNTIGPAVLEIGYLDDETKVVMGDDTSLLFNGNTGGKTTNLSGGNARFEVVRQPVGRPMVLASYNAEATLLEPGIYIQTYSNSGTRFDVQEGSLVTRRYSDGRTDTVAAGQSHTCRADDTAVIKFDPDGMN